MTDPRAKYEAALDRLAVKGNRYATIGAVVYWGCACGLDADELIADVRARGVVDRDSDVRRNNPSAKQKVEAFEANSRNRAKSSDFSTSSAARRPGKSEQQKAKAVVSHVRRLIDIGRTKASEILERDERTLTACSLMRFVVEVVAGAERLKPRNQSIVSMQTLHGLDLTAYVEVRADKTHRRPRLGEGIRTSGEWIEELARMRDIGEIVSLNPLTGEERPNANGRPSLIVRRCVASFRQVLMEFDALDLKEQLFFWIGVLLTGELNVLTLTFSGKKSIHAVVEIEADTLEEWDRVRDEIRRRYANDSDVRYRLDVQSLTPEAGTRLAGVRRSDTGLIQELLYVRPSFEDEANISDEADA